MIGSIPILITLDIHCYPETEKELPLWLDRAIRLFDDLAIRATFFFPAVFAEKFADQVRIISKRGHEIGCHGLTHDVNEQYGLMPYEKQKSMLHEAKKRIEGVIAKDVVSFRSPIFKINGNTIKALEENEFKVDSSVNSQRLGIFSSDITNIGWLYSPRRPYHPSRRNPFVTGDSLIWEMPQSAFIFPFISNTGIAFGGAFMELFFQALHAESNLRHNPIVYMFHPEEVCPDRERVRYKFEWRHLVPSKKTGFEIRKALFHNKDPKRIERQIAGLLGTMKKARHAGFVTCRGMLDLLESEN